MRVLMTSWAWPSHYLPMVPLGWALRAAGHEVRVASQPALRQVITDSGQVAVATGPDLDHAAVHRRVMGDVGVGHVPHPPKPGETMRTWNAEARDRVRRVFSVFGAYAEAMLDDLHAYAVQWRPDLIVFDPTTFAAPVVAAALGVPSVRHVHGVDVTYQARDVMAELAAPLAHRLGVGDVPVLGQATVDPCPSSMQVPSDVTRVAVRFVPYNGRAVVPAWLHEPAARNRICVTWGTSTTRIAGRHLFAPPLVIEAVRDLDVEVVVAVTDADTELLTGLPDNVRVVRGLALDLVLPHCAAMVHQGGNGTLLTGAYHGVPQLVLPQLPDQTFHTKQYVATGAGVSLADGALTPEAIKAAVIDVLSAPRYRSAASALRAEIRACPSPAAVVPRLVALAGGQR